MRAIGAQPAKLLLDDLPWNFAGKIGLGVHVRVDVVAIPETFTESCVLIDGAVTIGTVTAPAGGVLSLTHARQTHRQRPPTA